MKKRAEAVLLYALTTSSFKHTKNAILAQVQFEDSKYCNISQKVKMLSKKFESIKKFEKCGSQPNQTPIQNYKKFCILDIINLLTQTDSSTKKNNCYMSGVMVQVSCVRFHVSGVMCQVFCVTCHMSLTPTAPAIHPPPDNSPTMHTRILLMINTEY